MQRKLWLNLAIIILIAAGALYIDQPQPVQFFGREINVRKGLDLQGGTQLTYALDTQSLIPENIDDAHQAVVEVIRRRIDAFGVSEPVIQRGTIGETRTVVVELPGVTNVDEAKNLIGKTAQLTFWEPNGETDCPFPQAIYLGEKCQQTELTGAHLKRADIDIQQPDADGRVQRTDPVVTLTFTTEGGNLFEQITERNIGQPVAIILDDQVVSAPTVQQKISGGTAIITGVGTVKEAKQLSIQLNAGALPVPISVIQERTIGPTLGDDAIQQALIGGLIGLLMVIIYMIAIYGKKGIFASAALVIYTLTTFAIFKLIPVTLTTAGIAGFVLSIGMAVDANILIFERMHEELRQGRTLKTATDEGFKRAWTSIRDSNVSSLITAAILFYFGTGLIKGFALTLSIGIIISMFTAITVTRTFLRIGLHEKIRKGE